MQDAPERELLERARAGDVTALEGLLERHQAQVYRFGMQMCRDPEDASEVLQDTLLAMARGIRSYRGASSLSTWLYAIARSFCIKKRRKSHSHDTDVPTESLPLADPGRAPDDMLASREVEHALAEAIGTLDPMYREVLVLRDVEGLTANEVAEVLGVSAQAVKSRLHRARLAVRALVAPMLGIPDGQAAPGTCPDIVTLFSQHLEDEISAEVCAEMERHLESCARCRGTCDSLKRTLALCRATGATVEVPASAQASVKIALRNFLAENVL